MPGDEELDIRPADIDNQPAPGVKGGKHRQRNEDGTERDKRKQAQPVPLLSRGQAAAGHPQERGQERHIREELQKHDIGGKPADARQFEKEDEEPDDEQVARLHPGVR